MNPSYLRHLRGTYARHASVEPDALRQVARRHAAMRRTQIMDLAAVATSLAYVDRLELDPLALQAIRDTNPSFDPSRIGEYSEQEWLGITNAAKGKYFEYLLVERLNAGESVGDLYLSQGHRAEIADSMNQAGWDVRIVDEDGRVVELLQLKATESAGYVRSALDKYPDIRVVATDEAADGLKDNAMVIDVNVSERELASTIDKTLSDLDPGVMDHFWESFNPLLPALVIAATQGYQVVLGKQVVSEAFSIAAQRAQRGLVAGSVGAALKVATDSLMMAAPASVIAGWLFDRSRNVDAMTAFVREKSERQRVRSSYMRQIVQAHA